MGDASCTQRHAWGASASFEGKDWVWCSLGEDTHAAILGATALAVFGLEDRVAAKRSESG